MVDGEVYTQRLKETDKKEEGIYTGHGPLHGRQKSESYTAECVLLGQGCWIL
jgi:hypothetical protein